MSGMLLNTDVSPSEKGFLFLLSLVWTANPVLELFRGALLHIPVLSQFSSLAVPILVCVAVLLSLPYVFKNIKGISIIFVLCVLFLYLTHYVIYTKNAAVLEFYSFSFLCIVLPHYLIGTLADINKLFKFLGDLSRAVIVLQFLYVFVYGAGARQAEEVSDLMMRAYSILPHLFLVIYLLIKERRIIDVAFVVVGLFQLFSFGNRGSLVALVLFLLLSIFQLPQSQVSIKWKWGITTVLVVSFAFIDKIASFLEAIISQLGLSTRLFSKLLEGTFFQDESRVEDYWKPLLDILKDAPFNGYGIGGDRVVGGVIYSHNIVIELLISFGLFLGLVFFIGICIHLYRGFRLCQDENTKSMILVLFCSVFFPLFVSGTYLNSPFFFLLLGICSRSISGYKKTRRLATKYHNEEQLKHDGY